MALKGSRTSEKRMPPWLLLLALAALAASASTAQEIYQFQSAGDPDQTPQDQLELPSQHQEASGTIEGERTGGLQLSSGLQSVVDGLDNVLDHVDGTVLGVVKEPLGLFGLEAEEATVRPGGNGVELGISIKLGGGEEDEKDQDEGKAKDSQSSQKEGESKTLQALTPQHHGPSYQ